MGLYLDFNLLKGKFVYKFAKLTLKNRVTSYRCFYCIAGIERILLECINWFRVLCNCKALTIAHETYFCTGT